jgi:hypothetical protein
VLYRQFLKRLDRHLERIDRHMADVREEMRLSREQYADQREFMRELTLRHERSTQAAVRTLDAQTRRLDDMGDQIRADTRAVLAVLDRLEPGAGAA